MTLETRVGHMATSILQTQVEDYIKAFTSKGKYRGDPKYLLIHQSLKEYNSNGQ